jgi:hypothetical protein
MSARARRRWSDVRVGEEIPPLQLRPGHVAVFLFGVAYWTPHRIHYDRDWARAEGYDDVLVTGPLLEAYAARALVRWAGDAASLRRLRVRNTATACAGQALELRGRVSAVRPPADGGAAGEVECEISVARADGTPVLQGSALLQLSDAG